MICSFSLLLAYFLTQIASEPPQPSDIAHGSVCRFYFLGVLGSALLPPAWLISTQIASSPHSPLAVALPLTLHMAQNALSKTRLCFLFHRSVPALPSPAQCQGAGLCGFSAPLASHWVWPMRDWSGVGAGESCPGVLAVSVSLDCCPLSSGIAR